MVYDFLIRGGRVIDPARGIDHVEDLLIYNSKIVPFPASGEVEAEEVIDASGCLVLPGLIDFHTHLFWRSSDIGLQPDLYTLPNGITAAVDAGSAGSCNFEAMLHESTAGSMITVKSFLNIAATGIVTEQYFENLNPEFYDEKRIAYLFERYAHEILGFKVRIGKRFSKELGLKPLEETKRIAREYGVPVCVHVVHPESDYAAILSLLDAGDILCHCYQDQGPYSILDEEGKVLPVVREARARGVIFDGASGRRNHSLTVIQKAIADEFMPDIISTDVVTHSIYRKSVFSLPYTVSEYYAAGMPLPEVIRAVTATPARLMGLEGKIGTLAPGAFADVAIFKMVPRQMVFCDLLGNELPANTLFSPQMTFKAGRIAYRNIEFTF